MSQMKSGFVTILGRPNVGKSTLMNHLIGQKIAITANKPQTTRQRIRTIYTDERGQIVFLDTPGIVRAKNKLGEYMLDVAVKTTYEADVLIWLVKPDPQVREGEKEIADLLIRAKKPVILVVNQIDVVPEQAVRETVEAYSALYDFDRVITVSALRSIRTDKVLQAIYDLLPYGPFFYDEDMVTDQPMREIVAEMIREKALRLLSDEIPHGIAVTIDSMKQRKNGLWDIEASVSCEKESHKGIIIGKGGAMLKKIGSQARADAEKMLEDQVNLKLYVKVKKDWRDDKTQLRNFGYYEKG
ncbi:MAG: GTPase Era [Lachnospiraceae bacterium]|nr:GTPase Era [Lachnospiraceae bacterium]